MLPKKISSEQTELFQNRLSNLLNPKHPLLQLSQMIPWESFEESFGTYFKEGPGQPPKPIRLMVGLLMLQHMEGLSDPQVVSKWVENPYWQAFCGYDYLQWEFPADDSSMTRWRKRLGEEGMEKILSSTIQTAVEAEVVKPKDLERVIADTTVMEKDIAYPTDSALLNKIRGKLVDLAKKQGLSLRQSYSRVGDQLVRKISGYAHAKQFKRLSQGVRKLKTYLGRVIRDIERKLSQVPEQAESFTELLSLGKQLLSQDKHSKNKIYSVHAPEVYCIAKGKARTSYEFGCKVGLVVTHKQGLVLSSKAFESAVYDGHTLQANLDQAEKLSGQPIKRAFVDRGYKGHGVEHCEVYIAGQRGGITKALKKQLKRRSAIEPHIGHMKSEGKLRRNPLKGVLGDKINALLCGVGHNLRLILNHIRLFLAFLWLLFFQLRMRYLAL
jgi:IS5 family transposase